MLQGLTELLPAVGAGAAVLEWLEYRATPQKEVPLRGLFSNHPGLDCVFNPGFIGRSNCGIEYRINSLGLRDSARDFLQPADRRVLALGNSFAMGASEDFASSFLVELEEALGRTGSAEVVKAGIGGYGTRSEWGYYRVFGRRYRSQVLVVLFFLGTDFATMWPTAAEGYTMGVWCRSIPTAV